jgi:hypothetical protein
MIRPNAQLLFHRGEKLLTSIAPNTASARFLALVKLNALWLNGRRMGRAGKDEQASLAN